MGKEHSLKKKGKNAEEDHGAEKLLRIHSLKRETRRTQHLKKRVITGNLGNKMGNKDSHTGFERIKEKWIEAGEDRFCGNVAIFRGGG